MEAVRAFAGDGGLVLGICNGFQVLCEAGLLPGALRPNASLSFVCRDVAAAGRARGHAVHPTAASPGRRLTIPIKHGEGCYFADDELLAELEATARSCSATRTNPNGSVADIAGVVNARRATSSA